MTDVLWTVPAIIVLLGTLIFVHELGHFAVAKLLRMRVDEFGFGLPIGPRLVRLFKRGETEYTIYPVPLGGFVKLGGMEPGEEDLPNGFMSKPWHNRFLVHLAGPFMSFFLAYFIFCTLGVTFGLPITRDVMNRVDLVMPDSVAFRAGLQSGDVIVAMNGHKLSSGKEMLTLVHASAFKQMTITVRRESREFNVRATPQAPQLTFSKLGLTVDFLSGESAPDQVSAVAPGSGAARDGFKVNDVIRYFDGVRINSPGDLFKVAQTEMPKSVSAVVYREGARHEISTILRPREIDPSKTIGLLGFVPKQRLLRVGLRESVRYGNEATDRFVVTTLSVLFSRKVKEAVGGPIAIADAALNSVRRGLYGYIELMGVLSLSLAIVNMLPIPVVDGGQMLLLLVEAVRRRRFSRHAWEMSQRIGWTMIAILFALIMYLDFSRLATNKLFR